jgi:uncharacterized membrane protein
MVKFKITTSINKPPEIVWNAFIDAQNMLHWTKYLEKVEVVKGKFGEVGATAHLHYLEKGRSYILEDKLLGYEEGKRILSQVSGQGMNIEVETILNALPNDTNISMTWNGTSKSFMVRFMLRLMQKKIAKQAKAELEHFKSLVENYGAKFPNNILEPNMNK